MIPARLPCRAFRLSGPQAFETVFRTGRRHEGRYIELVVVPAAGVPGRCGYVIARRVLRRAVDRNRLRRRVREAVRRARPALAAFDVIVRVKRAGDRSEQDAAAREAAAMIARIAGGAVADSPTGGGQ
jgi:ribonuclease P protein component